MNANLAKLLEIAAQEIEVDCDLREDYSGRGMFGKITHAVVIDDKMQLAQLTAIATRLILDNKITEYTVDNLTQDVGKLKFDSMGKYSIVVY